MSSWGLTVVYTPHQRKTGPSDRHECLAMSALEQPRAHKKQYYGKREEVMADHKPGSMDAYYVALKVHRIFVLCLN